MPSAAASLASLELLPSHSPTADTEALVRSTWREDVAAFMMDRFLRQVEAKDKDIAADLRRLSALMLDGAMRPPDAEAMRQEILDRYEGSDKELALLGNYVRLAQLLELAGHLARQNFLDARAAKFEESFDISSGPRNRDEMVPGSLAELLPWNNGKNGIVFHTVEEAVAGLSRPLFKPVLTAHPTDIMTLTAQQKMRGIHDAMREIAQTKEQFTSSSLSKVDVSIREFREEELTPLNAKKGKIRSFTPAEEVDIELDTLKQIYKGLDSVYNGFESYLRHAFGDGAYSGEQHLGLDLKLRISSWVMGDKDGNNTLKAEHLLHAVVRHRLEIFDAYVAEIRGVHLSPDIDGVSWNERLERTHAILAALDADMRRAALGNDTSLDQSKFNRIMRQAEEAIGVEADGKPNYMATYNRLAEALNARYRLLDRSDDDASFGVPGLTGEKEATLSLLRKVRTFGFRFANIELRDKSEVYTDVVALLLKGESIDYEAMDAGQRAAYLNDLLTKKPDRLRELADEFLSQIEDTSTYRTYKKNDPRIAAYHTLKRHQLAVSQPTMFRNMVLAECQGVSNLMEALAIQRAVARPTGSSEMNITPLLEELETLNSAPRIFEETLSLKAYRQHLLKLAKDAGHPGEIRLKIQLAHSDNSRRGGPAAARGAIHDAYGLQKYLDMRRSHILNEFGEELRAEGLPADIFKVKVETFTGGSLSDPFRNGVRAPTASITDFNQAESCKTTVQGGDQRNYFGYSTAATRFISRIFVHCSKLLAGSALAADESFERVVGWALADTYEHYDTNHFNHPRNPIDYLFGHPLINFGLYSTIANRGSREASRTIGAAHQGTPVSKKCSLVPPKNVRTIAFSNIFNDANILPTWLGMSKLRGVGGVDAHTIYKKSRRFRDVIDKAAYGLLNTDIPRLEWRLKEAERIAGLEYPVPLKEYIEQLKDEYVEVSKQVLEAFGRPFPWRSKGQSYNDYLTSLQHELRKALPHLVQEIMPKQRMDRFLCDTRDRIILRAAGKPGEEGRIFTDEELRELSDIQCGRLVRRHGRYFSADDPNYSQAFEQEHRERSSVRARLLRGCIA